MEEQIKDTTTNQAPLYTITERVIFGTGFALIGFVGIIGNSLVLIAVAKSRGLQTIPNVFIVNLAVADILFCFITPLLVVSLLEEYHWYFDKMCCMALFVTHSSIGCSSCTLASIALNRFLLMVAPRKYYRIIFRPRLVCAWIAIVWIYAMTIAGFPTLVLGIGKLTFDPTLHYCRSPTTHKSSELYDTILIYGYFPFQLVLTVICYIGIFVRVCLHNRTMVRYRRNNLTSLAESLGHQDNASHVQASEANKQQMNITKNMAVILCASLLCYTPHIMCDHIYKECPIDGYLRLLVTANSAINPIIYGINHPQFRRVYINILKCDTIT